MGHFSWQPVPKGVIGTVICPFKPATVGKPVVPLQPVPNISGNPMAPPQPPPMNGNIPRAPPQAPQAPTFDVMQAAKNSIAGPYQVPLEIGDLVYILEEYTGENETGGWLRGYVFPSSKQFMSKPLIGIFPINYIHAACKKDFFDDAYPDEMDSYEGGGGGADDMSHSELTSPIPLSSSREFSGNLAKNNNDDVPDMTMLNEKYRNRKSNRFLGNDSNLRMRAWMMKKHIHQPLPASIEPTHTTTAGQEETLIDEIASVLREWGALLKQYLKQQKYDLFTTVRELFQILFQGRRQLLARTLSEEELIHLRRELIKHMDEGNRIQNLDVIMRDPNTGKIVDVKKDGQDQEGSKLTVLQIYRMHMMKAEEEENQNNIKIKTNSIASNNSGTSSSFNSASASAGGPIQANKNLDNSGPLSAPVQSSYSYSSSSGVTGFMNPTTNSIVSRSKVRISYTPLNLLSPNSHLDELATKFSHLFFQFRQISTIFCSPSEFAEYSVALYNKAENRFVSETFLFKLNAFNQPYNDNGDFTQLRTLFVDLSHRDLNDNIYMVIKIVRVGKMNMNDKELLKFSEAANSNGNLNAQTASSNPNLFRTTVNNQMSSSMSNINSSNSNISGNGIFFRRPFGCAVMELGNILSSKQEIKAEYTLKIYIPNPENQFSVMHESIINQTNSGYEIPSRPYSIQISLAMFNGNAATVIKENQALFASTAITPRHGFSDVILPGDFRNALYLTLVSGDFLQGRKTSGRNICVNVRVRLNSGNFEPNCIKRGSGGNNISEYESVIYYHCNQPKWQETIRIDMAAEDFEHAHIFFLFRHCSSKEKITDRSDKIFGYAFLPLVRRNNTVINDSLHNIHIYRYDKKLEHPSIYIHHANMQNTDSNNQNLDGGVSTSNTNIFSTSTNNENVNSIAEQASRLVVLKDTFSVRTALCSTKLTQNVALLNLLHWKKSKKDNNALEKILREFMFIGELEIIKFLKDILEALFSILACKNNSDGNLNDLVMRGLIFTLSIVMDKRFTNHRPFVDDYIEHSFKHSKVWENLINAFHKLLSDPVSPNSAKEIRNAIKVQQYLFKFIIQSHALFYVKEIDQQPDEVLIQIKNDLKNRLNIIFESFNKMMELIEPDAIIGSQTLTLQYMPTLISDLLVVYTKEELSEIMIDFIDSVKNNKSKIIGYKLTFIYHLLCSPLYMSMESRPQLTKATIRWITEYLSKAWVLPVSYAKSTLKNDNYANTTASEENILLNSNANLMSSVSNLNNNSMAKRSTCSMGSLSNISSSITYSNLTSFFGGDNLRLCLLVISELIDRFSNVDTDYADDDKSTNEEANSNSYGNDDVTQNYRLSQMPPMKNVNEKAISPIVIMNGLLPRILLIYSKILDNINENKKSISSSVAQLNKIEKTNSTGNINEIQQKQLPVPNISYTELGELTIIVLLLFCNLTDKEVAHFFLSQYKEGEKEKMMNYNMSGGGVETVNTLLNQLFTIFQSMLTSEHIPAKWVVPNILMHKIIVKIMRPISGLMRYMFIPKKNNMQSNGNSMISTTILKQVSNSEFNSPLWHDYFKVIISLLNSPYVQIEKFPPQKRRASALLNGDIRDVASEMLLKMWKCLNIKDGENYQMLFIPNLVGPLLELSMSPNVSVRASSIEMLFNMIENEYNKHHQFNSIQVECIDKMDRLVMGEGKGDESYKRFFIDALDAKLSSSNTPIELRDTGLQFLSSMDEFLRLMLCVRDLTELGKESSTDLWEAERMQGTLKLMKWMKVIDSKNIYLKHVYNLYEMHKNNQNYIEAGYTLKLHADLLEWNVNKILEPMPEYGYDTEESAFERKEKIYLKIIDCFETSKAWEKAIQLCKELIYQYENVTLNYYNLFEMLKRESHLYECICSEERYFSNYFRVGFYGVKWHSMLRNKQFVYRGIEWEKIGPFCERIVNKYSNSQLLRSNQPPDREIKYGDILYIQITAIQPEPSWENWIINGSSRNSMIDGSENSINQNGIMSSGINQSTNVNNITTSLINEGEVNIKIDPNSEEIIKCAEFSILDSYPDYIRKYYESNEVRTFSFNRPFKKQNKKSNENEFLDLWTEKTILITENKFPSLLRRSEVIYAKIIELCPIENAVLSMISKNHELKMAKERYLKAEEALYHGKEIPSDMKLVGGGINTNPLTMLLNGSVDARVNGGVPMYRKAFLCPEYLEQNPEHNSLIEKLKKLIENQTLIIYDTLQLHDRIVTIEMRPLHENLITFFHKTFENEIEALQLMDNSRSTVKLQRSRNNSTISGEHVSITNSTNSIHGHHQEKSEMNSNLKDLSAYGSLSNLPLEKIKNNSGSIKLPFTSKRYSNNSLSNIHNNFQNLQNQNQNMNIANDDDRNQINENQSS